MPNVEPDKKITVFRVTDLKIIGRVGTHIFLFVFVFLFQEKYNFKHFERQLCLSKMHTIIFFLKPERKSRFHQ